MRLSFLCELTSDRNHLRIVRGACSSSFASDEAADLCCHNSTNGQCPLNISGIELRATHLRRCRLSPLPTCEKGPKSTAALGIGSQLTIFPIWNIQSLDLSWILQRISHIEAGSYNMNHIYLRAEGSTLYQTRRGSVSPANLIDCSSHKSASLVSLHLGKE